MAGRVFFAEIPVAFSDQKGYNKNNMVNHFFMFKEPRTKLNFVLFGIGLTVVLAVLDPFIIRFSLGGFSQEFFQGTFLVLDFLVILYLWKQFNGLRITINKKELEDGDLLELEKNVQQITHTKPQ